MQTRTTILLDTPSRQAAKQLAAELDVSPSEVIRRALVHYRDHIVGAPSAARLRRRRALEQATEVFAGVDADAEVARMKREDEGW